MTVSGLVDLAVTRGTGAPEQAKRWRNAAPPPAANPPAAAPGAPAAAPGAPVVVAAPPAAPAAAPDQKSATGLSVIISAIPVEIVALYTTIVAASVSGSTPSTAFLEQYQKDHGSPFPYGQTQDLIGWRWLGLLAFALLTIGFVFKGWKAVRDPNKDTRTAPVSELFAGVAAFVVWGLTMPGGILTAYIQTSTLGVASFIIIGAAAGLLILFGHAVLKNAAA